MHSSVAGNLSGQQGVSAPIIALCPLLTAHNTTLFTLLQVQGALHHVLQVHCTKHYNASALLSAGH